MPQKLIAALVLIVSTLLQVDNGFIFKTVHKEDTSYRMTTRLVSDSYVDYQGSEEVLNEIRSKGVKFPMHVTQTQTIVVVSETGSKATGGAIPFSGRIDSITKAQYVNGQLQSSSTPDPMDTTFRMSGSFKTGTITIDKITGKNIDPAMADALKGSLGKMMQSVKFPESPLKVGQSFSQTVPMSLPIPGADPMQAEITTTYVLRKMNENMAFFDFKQKSNMASRKNNATIEMADSGNGTMVYDRGLGQMIKMETQSFMKMKVSAGPVSVVTKGNTKSETTMSATRRR
jgi:hypothetical protein